MMVSGHCPDALVVQELTPPTKTAPGGLLGTVKLTTAPGAGTKPKPSALSCRTVAVIVCGCPTSFVFVGGVRLIVKFGLLLMNVQTVLSPATK